MECQTCHTSLPSGAAYCHACGSAQPGAAEPADCRYAAFISYRHRDADRKAAIEVQKAIETYRLPRGVTCSAHGGKRASSAGSRSLGACFRDEDELPATHSLPEHIARALEQSSSLVVICSRETPGSTWVLREIETFAQAHGRNRIFAVLVDGTSAQSIPAPIRTRVEVDENGAARTIASEPLAADLRPDAQASPKVEKLRIVAAVAGCGFDDLRRRERKRKRTRAFAIAASGLALLVLVAVLALGAHASNQEARTAESLRLAAESQQLLERGDRYGAIEAALAALDNRPAGSEPSAPGVDEARQALEKALDGTVERNSVWHACYSIETEHSLSVAGNAMTHRESSEAATIGALAASGEGTYFAVSDDSGAVATYDARTGRKLAQFDMSPAEADGRGEDFLGCALAATENYLIVAHAGRKNTLGVYDAETGAQTRSVADAAIPAFDTSYGADLVSMAYPLAGDGLGVTIADLGSGQASSVEFDDVGKLDAQDGYCCAAGERLGECYAAFGNELVYANLDTARTVQASLALPYACSVQYGNGIVVAVTADRMGADGVTRRYAIEAFDNALAPLWRHEGAFVSEMVKSGDLTTLIAGEPQACFCGRDGGEVAVRAGRDALVLDAATGDPIANRTYDQTVVEMAPVGDAGPADGEAAANPFVVACSNGTVTLKDFGGVLEDAEGDGTRLALPYPIRWARIVPDGDGVIVLVAPADTDNSICAFRTDFSREAQPERARSLDELVALGREALEEAGS